jgi:hypothetical protein
MALPLLIGGACIVTSVIGTYMVRLGKGGSIMGALYKGFWTAAILGAVAVYFATQYALGDMNATIASIPGLAGATITLTGMKLFYCMLIGLALTGAAGLDHRILYRDQLPAGEVDRPPRRPATAPTSSRASPSASNRRRFRRSSSSSR